MEKCPVTELIWSPMLLSLPNREKKQAQCDSRWFHASESKGSRYQMSPDAKNQRRKGKPRGLAATDDMMVGTS